MITKLMCYLWGFIGGGWLVVGLAIDEPEAVAIGLFAMAFSLGIALLGGID